MLNIWRCAKINILNKPTHFLRPAYTSFQINLVQKSLFSNEAHENYYDILEIQSTAKENEVKSAYLKLAKKYQPDVSKEKDAFSKLQNVSVAYEVLSDKHKRKEYDAYRSGRAQGAGGHPGWSFHSTKSAEDIYKEVFGGDLSGSTDSISPVSVRISFEEASSGVQKTVKVNAVDTCGFCRGSGFAPGKSEVSCSYCNGTRFRTSDQGFMHTCSYCKGQGKYSNDSCQTCDGTGKTMINKEISVSIPPGVNNGEMLRIQVGKDMVDVHVQVQPSLADQSVIPPPTTTAQPSTSARILTRLGIEKIPDDIPEDEKKKQKMTRNTRLGMLVLSFGSVAGLIWFCIHYGRAKKDELGNVIVDNYSGSVLAPIYRIADGFKEWLNYAVEPSREKLLPDPLRPPYIQPKYTLVIEMKNVLVAPEWTYKTGYRFKKRPALDYFLDVVGYPNFELVIYTSEPPMSAFSVVDSIDPKQRIVYRLFRDCTKYTDGHHVKDLNRLNRDLSKVIFIDFDSQSAKLNPENVLRVPKWDGDMDDTALVDLAELLKTIHLSDTDDVRPTLQHYSSYDDPPAEFRRKAIQLAEWEQQQRAQKAGEGGIKKYTGFFGFRRHQNV